MNLHLSTEGDLDFRIWDAYSPVFVWKLPTNIGGCIEDTTRENCVKILPSQHWSGTSFSRTIWNGIILYCLNNASSRIEARQTKDIANGTPQGNTPKLNPLRLRGRNFPLNSPAYLRKNRCSGSQRVERRRPDGNVQCVLGEMIILVHVPFLQ